MNKYLAIVAAFVFFIIISTTVVVCRQKSSPPQVQAQTNLKPYAKTESLYKGLGTLRATTLPDERTGKQAAVIAEPVLVYPLDDKEFFEELSQKNQTLKTLVIQYFSSKTKQDLQKAPESSIKKDLLGILNSTLSLNSIKELYFITYTIID